MTNNKYNPLGIDVRSANDDGLTAVTVLDWFCGLVPQHRTRAYPPDHKWLLGAESLLQETILNHKLNHLLHLLHGEEGFSERRQEFQRTLRHMYNAALAVNTPIQEYHRGGRGRLALKGKSWR